MSIRFRLLLLVIAVLVAASGVAVWLIGDTWAAGRAAQEQQARDSTLRMASVIERELSQLAVLARVLAASPLLDQGPSLSGAERAAFEQTARRATAGTPWVVQVLGADGVWQDTAQPGARPLLQPASRPTPIRGQAALEWLRPSAPGGAAYVAWIEPVLRGEGAARGALRVLLPVARLQAALEQAPPPVASNSWLLNARGEPVLRHPQAQAAALDQTWRGTLQQNSAGRGGAPLALSDAQGQPWQVHFSPLSQGWTYASAWPRAGLDAPLAQALVRLAIAAVLLPALALGAALWMVRAELHRRVAAAVQHTQRRERWTAQRERTAALGRLTGRVAHEFNNLLGIISNSAHLMQRHADSPALGMPVAATLRAVDSASRLTQHLLRFGGRQRPQARTVALGEWLPGLRDMLTVVLGKRIALSIQVPDAPLYTRVDPEELELAIINLVLNAREVLPEGGRVDIAAGLAPGRMLAELPAGPYVFVSVRDDGPGLDAAQTQRAFEPLVTGREADPEAGFGLSQVQGLCVQAGGRALIESRPGEGTEVCLVLPAVAPEAAPPLRERAGPAARLRARVLLAEDNDALSEVTAALIQTMGASVERATHAAQALERLERGPAVDVLLSNVSMPGDMDGLGLARAVRARWPGVRVVLISASGQRLAGAEHFTVLTKPCAPQALLAALKGDMGTPHAP